MKELKKLGPLVRVTAFELLGDFRVLLTFADGTQKQIDLEPYLRGPIFEPVRKDPHIFADMSLEGGTICWPNGADIDPDVLYYGLEPAWKQESEPS
ncbi:MAG: DUF2442 domain-containing protein [Ardenticatenaceae bacterium]|nr:DUF2442 domain-containing protein [Ardenticatenaceae bacterium]